MTQPNVKPSPLRYFVDGMDCAACARKIEDLVTRTPGARQPRVSFTAQSLSLELDETRTTRAQLEASIRSLGYTPMIAATSLAHHTTRHDHTLEDRPWYTSRQGRLVMLTGGLLGAAWLFGWFEPRFGTWAYVLASILGTFPLARRAWAATRLGNPWTIETLVTLAVIGALGIGEAPEAAVVVFFFMIGELLEGIAAGRARAGIKSLAALTPKTALVVHGDHTHEIRIEDLEPRQIVRVPAGARVPCDGVIERGSSSFDDSPVTGESLPVEKTVGGNVYAGSINGEALVDVRVTRASSDNTISRIVRLVEEAEHGKGNTARFIDRFSRVWTPTVVLVSTLVAVIPPSLFGGAWHDWLYKGVSLLLIGCPCALVLSVPAAITSALSSAARRGLLVKGGATLEAIGSVATIAFDKTGTLTTGKPRVTDVIPLALERDEALRLAAGVENGSSHPLAKAILEAARAENLEIPTNTDAKVVTGKAVTATVEGRSLAVGSPRWYADHLDPTLASRIAALETSGKTVVVLLEAETPLALLAIRDESRADAKLALERLRTLGISSLMLTGDNARAAQAIATELGVKVRAELMPEDKLEIVALKAREGGVAFVGDGINDAPALARATVGIAMGSGTDVALETADAALLHGNVSSVAALVRLSRAAMANVRVNIGIALGLKAVFFVTTLLGWTNLWMAILADTGATVLVTANALRLLNFAEERVESDHTVAAIQSSTPT
jgi:Zn2+/Cd2+-exporting ATPase